MGKFFIGWAFVAYNTKCSQHTVGRCYATFVTSLTAGKQRKRRKIHELPTEKTILRGWFFKIHTLVLKLSYITSGAEFGAARPTAVVEIGLPPVLVYMYPYGICTRVPNVRSTLHMQSVHLCWCWHYALCIVIRESSMYDFLIVMHYVHYMHYMHWVTSMHGTVYFEQLVQ